jgi:dihydroorotate dehydrogenase electron transfer subunit
MDRGPPIRQAECQVVSNRWINDRYKHLIVEAPPAALAARPGQFFQLLCPGEGQGNHLFRRPMSIYRVDRAADRLEFLYKVVGVGTRGLAGLEPGGSLDVFGPLGHGFRLEAGWRHAVLLARGVGLATLAPLAEAAVAEGIDVTAILSASAPDQLMSVDYLRGIGAEVVTVTDTEGSSAPLHVEALLRRIADERGCDMIATCGSNRLLILAKRLGAELGIAGQVALESHMACGVGACFGCVRPFTVGERTEIRRVCADGPVFDVQEVPAW